MKRATVLSVALLGLAFAAGVQGQDFPNRPLRLLVGFPPGGPIDIQARLLAQKLSDSLRQPVVVDNRPGADGVIATGFVAKAEPDGHTLILASIGFATVPAFSSKLPYDPAADFAPVIYAASGAMVLAAHPSLAATGMKDLLELARATPGQINYGSAGIGSSNHLGVELFSRAAGVRMHHVPYKGAAPATTDLLAGQIQLMLNPISNALPHVRSGKLKALGVSTARRSAAAPEIPAIAETVAGFDVSLWSGVFAPAATPPAVVAVLNREFGAALQTPDLKATLASHGFEPVGGTPADFRAYVAAELRRWQSLVRDASLKTE